MIELKKSNPALAYGKYKVAENSNDHVFSFYRFTDTEKILVVVNLSGSPEQALVQIDRAEKYKSAKSLLNGKTQKVKNYTSLLVNILPYKAQGYKLNK